MAETHVDVVVIGGGIAGLSAAAHLAQAGKRVVLFEQHDKPGGYYTSFVRRGIIFDITAHWTVAPADVNKLLADLNAPGIDFVHHPFIGQYFGPDSTHGIWLGNDRHRFVRSILDAYPTASPESIDTLIDLSLKVEAEIAGAHFASPELMSPLGKIGMLVQLPLKLRNVMKYGNMPAEDLLTSLFPGEALAGLRAALYMLAPIKDFNAIGILLYIGFALRGKAYQPRGGAIAAAQAFAEAAHYNGAQLRCGETVTQILVEDQHVRGVVLQSGEVVKADYVVSAADIRQTFFTLMDRALVPAEYQNKLETTPISSTFVIVSLVVDANPADFGFEHMDAFYTDTADIAQALTPDDPARSLVSIQFPEFRDETADPSHYGVQLVALASFDFREQWASGDGHTRTESYRAMKEKIAAELVARAEKYWPGLRDHIVEMDIATPLTMHAYTRNDQGASVGWSYTSKERWTQRVPFVDGLYLAGHWVGPSGVYNVAKSGKNAAELILRGR